MNVHPDRLAALVVVLASLACGSGRRTLPTTAPTVDWEPLRYVPQPPDGPRRGTTMAPDGRQLARELEHKYGEPFVVTGVSKGSPSLPGMPGRGPGGFQAYPSRDPSLWFGGDSNPTGSPQLQLDNYPCIRRFEALRDFAATLDGPDRAVVASHGCTDPFDKSKASALDVFDASGDSIDVVVQALHDRAAPLRAALPGSELTVNLSSHPRGTSATLRQVVTTSRRATFARQFARRFASRSVRFDLGSATPTPSERPLRRNPAVEAALAPLVEAHRPADVAGFRLYVHGSGADLASWIGQRARASVEIHVTVGLDLPAEPLVQWLLDLEHASDERIVWYLVPTHCRVDALADPWRDPSACDHGWDGFTAHVIDRPRRPPEFWPFPQPPAP